MEQIGSILKNTPSSTANAVKATAREARKAGIKVENVMPKRCEYCGRLLQPTGLLIDFFGGKRLVRQKDEYELCDCEGAKEHRKREALKWEEQQKAEQEQAYRKWIERAVIEGRIGKRFVNRTFDSFTVTPEKQEAYDTTKAFADNFPHHLETGEGLMLAGGYGTGKTHLAAAIFHEVIKQGYQPIFGTLISLLGQVKASYDGAGESEDKIIRRYAKCNLLIIDDLGKERPTEWLLEKAYHIINSRYEDCLPVVVTTNYGIDELAKRLAVGENSQTAEAIVSRIYEMCQGVLMNWGDYRKS